MKEYLVYYHLQAMVGNLMQPFKVEVFERVDGLTAQAFVNLITDDLERRCEGQYSVQITDIKPFE